MPDLTDVLVVDDETHALQIVSFVLEYNQIRCRTAETGQIALERLHERRPDLLLLDLSMPDMNGWEVLAKIRDDAAFSDLIIIAVTGMARPQDLRAILDAGFDGYLIKPISVKDLVEKLRKFLERGPLKSPSDDLT